MRICSWLVLGLFLMGMAAPQGRWQATHRALSGWAGVKEAVVRSDASDPLSSSVVQELVRTLLDLGFSVRTVGVGASAGQGLTVDVRERDGAATVAVLRSADGIILSLEKGESAAEARSDSRTSDSGTGRGSGRARANLLAETAVKLSGTPRGLGVLRRDVEGADVVLLRDEGLEVVRLSGGRVEPLAWFRPQLSPRRALRIEAEDLDRDGVPEVGGVWAEDSQGIDEGVDSRVHAWLFRWDGTALKPVGGDLQGYVRFHEGRGYLQRKGSTVPFSGPLFALALKSDGVEVGAAPIHWEGRSLYEATPWGAKGFLTWDEGNRLRFLTSEGPERREGGFLLEDMGRFSGPEIGVRLDVPEYRSGFARVDRVMEKRFPMPRRVQAWRGDAMFTIRRGRSRGLPLVGTPSGRDALVRLSLGGGALAATGAFEGVDGFILDFGVTAAEDGTAEAFLLASDADDGAGGAWLVHRVAAR